MKVTAMLDEMHELFKDYPPTELNYETPFQCLVAVILSAQTTDIQVNKVTDTLFEQVKGPEDILDLGENAFNQAISSIGLHNSKAKNIYKTSKQLIELTKEYEKHGREEECVPVDEERYCDKHQIYEQNGYIIPDKIDEMQQLPGVGLKTAKVVLYVLYGQLWIAADTHVHRVMNRLNVVDTKSPNQTSNQLEKIIPDDYKSLAHHVIIYFGRYLCKAKQPECWRCPLFKACGYKEKNLTPPTDR